MEEAKILAQDHAKEFRKATEAFDLDTYSGTAKGTSQGILASEAACHPERIIASLILTGPRPTQPFHFD